MSLIDHIHEHRVAGRRVDVLGWHLALLLPENATVLDVGCGDGQIAQRLGELRKDVTFTGVDVLVRDDTAIPVELFDGQNLPFEKNSFDAVMFVDVLHHADDIDALMGEAVRVARQAVVIKDHKLAGFAASKTLRFMDWVGNHRHGVSLPYNYLSPAEWRELWQRWNLEIDERVDHLGLYPWPASILFERGLHFAARLRVPQAFEAPITTPTHQESAEV